MIDVVISIYYSAMKFLLLVVYLVGTALIAEVSTCKSLHGFISAQIAGLNSVFYKETGRKYEDGTPESRIPYSDIK